jgi:hypothetical protein
MHHSEFPKGADVVDMAKSLSSETFFNLELLYIKHDLELQS